MTSYGSLRNPWAILTKLYPVLLLLVLVRRRDWGLPAACALTMVLGYLPFLVLSHGQIAAVVFSFRDQDLLHPSILQNTLLMLGSRHQRVLRQSCVRAIAGVLRW
jgi:hypothetical protein